MESLDAEFADCTCKTCWPNRPPLAGSVACAKRPAQPAGKTWPDAMCAAQAIAGGQRRASVRGYRENGRWRYVAAGVNR